MKLTNDNYYSIDANIEYMSVSQYKDFKKCEAMAMAKIRGEHTERITKPLLVGSFVDAYFEGNLSEFIQKNPGIFTRQNELRSEFKKANEIIDRVKKDPNFMRFLNGEKQKILTFELFGVKWKIKMDSYIENICITDLKVVANFKSIPLWRYDFQGAIYQKGVEIITSKKLPFYLAAATKERVVDFDIFQITQPDLDAALEEIQSDIEHFINVKKGIVEPAHCGKCDYCKTIKTSTIRNYSELLEGNR